MEISIPTTGMPINVTKPPTDDPLVRQAIMYAVDQDALVKGVLYDVYKPAQPSADVPD